MPRFQTTLLCVFLLLFNPSNKHLKDADNYF